MISVLAAACLVVLASGACGGSAKKHSTTPTSSPSVAAPTSGDSVSIKNFAFSPTPLHAHVGDKVTVKNLDPTAHTVTANDGSFDSGSVPENGTATLTLAKAGSFSYHCNIHNYMTGVIEVS